MEYEKWLKWTLRSILWWEKITSNRSAIREDDIECMCRKFGTKTKIEHDWDNERIEKKKHVSINKNERSERDEPKAEPSGYENSQEYKDMMLRLYARTYGTPKEERDEKHIIRVYASDGTFRELKVGDKEFDYYAQRYGS